MTTVEQSFSDSLHETAETLEKAYHQLPVIITRLLLAGLAIVAGLLLLRFVRHVINRRIAHKDNLPPRMQKQRETLRSLLGSVISYLMYFFIALVVLRIFGIDLTSSLWCVGAGQGHHQRHVPVGGRQR